MKNRVWIILRRVAYVLIPILFALFIVQINVINEVERNGLEVYNADSYYDSELFYDDVYVDIQNGIYNVVHKSSNPYDYKIIITDEKITENDDVISTNEEYGLVNVYDISHEKFDLVVVDHGSNKIYLNNKDIEFDSFDDIIEGEHYYKFESGVIDTDLGAYGDFNVGEMDIYFSMHDINYTNMYYWNNLWYEVVNETFEYAIINIILIGALFIFFVVSMFIGIGRIKNSDEISLSFIDNIPYEIVAILSGMLWYCSLFFIDNIFGYVAYAYAVIILIYILGLMMVITTLKRIKCGEIFKNTIAYRCFKLLIKSFKKMSENFMIGFIIMWLFGINILVLILGFVTLIPFILFVGIYVYMGYYLYKRYTMIKKIDKLINDIYENKDYVINKDDYLSEYYEVVEKLDNISKGFNEALDSKIASERMKSELITNVSHDIKTPLTSIINYVDLLKKENIKDKKVLEYIDILSVKSDRLKKLTEDLVEVSKASSGNLKIDFSKINVYELINQVNGEYSEKFKKNKLDIECSDISRKLNISADSKYIYRVMDNLYSNVVKYSMNNTRVYVDVVEDEKNVIISIKNISKEKLNIGKEELIQRFVRGDSSRSESGSGLGLSIVENLVRLQDGLFDIIIDGDLFKVSITFRKW